MKSLVGFLTEAKKPNPNPTSSSTGGGGGPIPQNRPLSSAEIERLKRQTQFELGGSSFDWWDETDDNIKDPKRGGRKFDNTTSGGPVRTNKPQQKPLGKLYRYSSKKDPTRAGSVRSTPGLERELEAKRRARINPKTGKATPQGVENYAQNRGGYSRRSIPKADLDQIRKDARRIASDPTSAEYKTIERKINRSDYAGKRGKLATPKELGQIKTDLGKSKTINTKVDVGPTSKAPTTFKKKPTSTVSLNTSTRRGRIVNPTPPDPSLRRSVKGPGSSTGYLSKGTLKFSGDSEYNKLKKIIKNTDGRSSNTPPVKPKPTLKPTPVSTGKPPLTNPQSMLRTPRKSTPKFDSAYNKKGDANLRKLLGKGKRPDYLRGGGPAQVGDPWDPKDYNTKGTSRQTTVDNLDKGFRKKWKEAQDKFKRNTQTKAPEPEWGKSTSKTPYKGTTIKNPTIRQYTSPTLTPSTTRTPFRTPVGPSGPSGSRTPVGGTTGTTGPSGTKSKVTRNDTIPKYKPKPWKTFKGALSKAFIPATIGAQSYIDTSSAQKQRGATKRRQVKTGLMDAGANVASWIGTGKLLDLHPAMRKRKLLKFALQTVAQPKTSEFVKNITGISKYKATQTKVEKQKGITAQQPSTKKLQKKYPSLVLPTSDQKNLLKKSNFKVNIGFNKTGKFEPKEIKNK